MKTIQYFRTITLLVYLILTGCFVSKMPTPDPQRPTDTPTDNGGKPTAELPTPSVNKPVDPDNLKINFSKPASDVYRDIFSGSAREVAKTHPSTAKTKDFASVGDVLKGLPTDSYMRRIGVSDNSPRTVDEDFNVFVKKAFLFSISKEADGDFHLIIGDLVNDEKVNLMTAEISGLPKDSTQNKMAYFLLERTRRQLYEKFPEFFTGRKKTYKPTANFPEIAIRGSLFFDNRHSAGQIGSGAVKPETVWEIHPITYLDFK